MRFSYHILLFTSALSAVPCYCLQLMPHINSISTQKEKNKGLQNEENKGNINMGSTNNIVAITEPMQTTSVGPYLLEFLQKLLKHFVDSLKTPNTTSDSKEDVTAHSKDVITESSIVSKTNSIVKANEETKVLKPRSYSEMKGIPIKNKNINGGENKLVKRKFEDIPKTNKQIAGKTDDLTTKNIHENLHRTNRYDSIRSIVYSATNPRKYSITLTKSKKDASLPNRVKYDIRHLDVEKLMDIIIPDAAALVYKYVRDLPSVPLILECKTGIFFPLVKILGGFKRINRFYDNTLNNVERKLPNRWYDMLFWIFRKKPLKPSVEEIAISLEYDLTMFSLDLPNLTDKDCEGDMNQADMDQFNFHYNYIMSLDQLAQLRKSAKKMRRPRAQIIK